MSEHVDENRLRDDVFCIGLHLCTWDLVAVTFCFCFFHFDYFIVASVRPLFRPFCLSVCHKSVSSKDKIMFTGTHAFLPTGSAGTLAF